MSPFFLAVPKPMLTEFGIHYRLESCVVLIRENHLNKPFPLKLVGVAKEACGEIPVRLMAGPVVGVG